MKKCSLCFRFKALSHGFDGVFSFKPSRVAGAGLPLIASPGKSPVGGEEIEKITVFLMLFHVVVFKRSEVRVVDFR